MVGPRRSSIARQRPRASKVARIEGRFTGQLPVLARPPDSCPTQHVPGDGHGVTGAQRGSALQDVVVASVQLVQNPHPPEPGRAQFEPQPTADAVADIPAGVEQGTVRSAVWCTAARHSGVRRPESRSSMRAPAGCQMSRDTYRRPRRQSIARSCQKLVSCSAVHTASDAGRRAVGRRSRRCAARAGRPDSPIAGSSRARRPTSR